MSIKSKVPEWIARHIGALLLSLGVAGGGAGVYVADAQLEAARQDAYVQAVAADADTSLAVKIAMVLGRYYESSGRHIGKPYWDKYAKGGPLLTVCNGITTHVAAIDAGRWYTPAECYALEKRVYIETEAQAIRYTVTWDSLNAFQQASIIDFIHNLGIGNYSTSTMRRKFNAGDFVGGCRENPRWVKARGTVLPGLVSRRAANAEICENWTVLED